MPLSAPSHPSLTQLRNFSCTAQNLAKSTKKRLAYEHIGIPEYPYGASQWYKQSNFGLYGTQKIRYGNMVSEKNEIKTRRHWRPNVHSKRLWSDSLQRFIRTRTTPKVLRTIDKCGGLDEYLLGEKAARIKELGMAGWKLRWRIMQTPKVKERFNKQREALGLPLLEVRPVGLNGKSAGAAQIQDEITQFDAELADEKEIAISEEAEGRSESVEEGFMHEETAKQGKVVL